MEENSNFNITPEMINNLANMLGSSNSDSSNTSNNTSSSNNSNSSTNTNSTDNNDSNNFNDFTSGIDIQTIFKIKSIMENLNKKDDPKSNLLYSLKPYLREPRQKKLDQYVNLLKISQITGFFKNEKGDGL